jgi:Zn-dependent oligopeptidase
VASVFFNLPGAATNDDLQAIERAVAPMLARHRSETYLNEALFKRVDALNADKDKLGLSAEQARVLDRYHLDFTRAGAGAPPEAKARLAAIAEPARALSRQISIGDFRHRIRPGALVIREQKQLRSSPPWSASRQYRIYSDGVDVARAASGSRKSRLRWLSSKNPI